MTRVTIEDIDRVTPLLRIDKSIESIDRTFLRLMGWDGRSDEVEIRVTNFTDKKQYIRDQVLERISVTSVMPDLQLTYDECTIDIDPDADLPGVVDVSFEHNGRCYPTAWKRHGSDESTATYRWKETL